MVNECESVIKTVSTNKRKWLITRLTKMVTEAGVQLAKCELVAIMLLGRELAPNPTYLFLRNVETLYRSCYGRTICCEASLRQCRFEMLEKANVML